MPTTSVDLEILLNSVPPAEGFLLSALYNAHDDYRYFGGTPVAIEQARLQALSDAEIDDYGIAFGGNAVSGWSIGAELSANLLAAPGVPLPLASLVASLWKVRRS
jgi:hypothetical protein